MKNTAKSRFIGMPNLYAPQSQPSISFQLVYTSIILLLGILLGMTIFTNRTDFHVNLYTEFIGIIVTAGIVDALNRYRDRQQELRQLKERLILEAGSTSNEQAKSAVHELRKRAWLTENNSLLNGKDLTYANLQKIQCPEVFIMNANFANATLTGSNLSHANLSQSNLSQCDLSHANLFACKLNQSDLYAAILQNASLSYAQLMNADLERAQLQGADLRDANLIGVNFQDANLNHVRLQGAKIAGANFAGAILPNGIVWSSGIDMTQFTRSNFPTGVNQNHE